MPVSLGNNIHIYQSDIQVESRVQRHCVALAGSGLFEQMYFLGCTSGNKRTEEFSVDCNATMLERADTSGRGLWFKLMETRKWSREVFETVGELGATCISCHSLPALAVCCRLKNQLSCRLVYEPHELETETVVSHGVRKWLSRRTEAFYIGHCDAVITVNDSIADWYASAYSITRPFVIKNMPSRNGRSDSPPDKEYFRKRYDIPKEANIFLYQGWIGEGRRISQYIRIFGQLNGEQHLILMGGFSDPDLESVVRQSVEDKSNIHYHEAVPPGDLLRFTACADVGLCGVEDICESYRLSLPNKIFEYLSAGIPCLAPDFPEIARVIRQTGAGWLHPDSESGLTKRILAIGEEDIDSKREHALEACEDFDWPTQAKALVSAYREVMQNF